MSEQPPLITVLIPTYNWSAVLRYAIQSVLWQTFQDFELLVIGDGCTDNSEQVVASFNDTRIRWHNLPQNTGNQAMPNNKGFELAHGTYIAYLEHDDLWFPNHLETMVNTIEATQADLVYAVMAAIHPLPSDRVHLVGLGYSDKYDFPTFNRSGTSMHRLDLIDEIGPWRHYRTIQLPSDVDFFMRACMHRRSFAPTHELTVIKFSASNRPNIYVEKPSYEQEAYAQRIQEDPGLRYELLMRALRNRPTEVTRLAGRMRMDDGLLHPGVTIEATRQQRGLADIEAPVEGAAEKLPVYAHKQMLYLMNNLIDIGPHDSRYVLFYEDRLPEDGLFVGLNWVGALYNRWGECYRTSQKNAQIIITRPTGRQQHMFLEIMPKGTHSVTLYVEDEAGKRVPHRQIITFDVSLAAGVGTALYLQADSDPPRFRVFRFGWAAPHASESAELRAEVERLCKDLDEQVLFRGTSLRYHARRLRQWLRGVLPT